MTLYDYLDKVCPYCKCKFQAFDDIVICSSCDMPHHRECWVENQGCTTFGCQGTIKRADYSSNSVTATEITFEDEPVAAPATAAPAAPVSAPAAKSVYCTQCGAENHYHHSFCFQCGAKLVKPDSIPAAPVYSAPAAAAVPSVPAAPPVQPAYYQTSPSYSYGNPQYTGYQSSPALDPDVVGLIGTKSEYYTEKFKELKFQNKKTSWNWPAFLVTPYWMIYRKMYSYGAACLGAAFLLSLLGGIFSIVSLAGYIALGIYGNYIYMDHLEKIARQAKYMQEPGKGQFLQQKGDVNTTAVILTVIGYGLVAALLL